MSVEKHLSRETRRKVQYGLGAEVCKTEPKKAPAQERFLVMQARLENQILETVAAFYPEKVLRASDGVVVDFLENLGRMISRLGQAFDGGTRKGIKKGAAKK